MIYYKSIFNKYILKIGIIIFFLYLMIFSLYNAFNQINKNLETIKNKWEYRTINIVPNDDINIENDLKKFKNTIEEYYSDSNSNLKYTITFKNYKNVEQFLKKNVNHYKVIEKYDYQETNESKVLIIVKVIIKIINVLLLILLSIFSIQIVSKLSKDIALYKLIGYSQNKIITFIIINLYIYYFLLFLFSILTFFYTIKLYNILFYSFYKLNYLLNANNYVFIWKLSNIPIILSFIIIIFKIRRYEPIKLINSIN